MELKTTKVDLDGKIKRSEGLIAALSRSPHIAAPPSLVFCIFLPSFSADMILIKAAHFLGKVFMQQN